MTPRAGAPFDLSYCRLFLMHMQEPVTVLEKMLFWTKPGGIVAAQEFDFGAIAVEPICPAMAEFNRRYPEVAIIDEHLRTDIMHTFGLRSPGTLYHIAVLDLVADTWSGLGDGMESPVYALALDNNEALYAGARPTGTGFAGVF